MFTLRHFSARLMTVTGKLELPIDRLSQSTNMQSETLGHSHESRTKKSSCKRTFRVHKDHLCRDTHDYHNARAKIGGFSYLR